MYEWMPPIYRDQVVMIETITFCKSDVMVNVVEDTLIVPIVTLLFAIDLWSDKISIDL